MTAAAMAKAISKPLNFLPPAADTAGAGRAEDIGAAVAGRDAGA